MIFLYMQIASPYNVHLFQLPDVRQVWLAMTAGSHRHCEKARRSNLVSSIKTAKSSGNWYGKDEKLWFVFHFSLL